MVTEGDTAEEALACVQDAVPAVVEIYEALGKPLPANLYRQSQDAAIAFEYAVVMP